MLEAGGMGFSYSIKSLTVDKQNIKFVEIPEEKPDSTKSAMRGVKYLQTEELNRYLLSEPLGIDGNTEISFSDEAGFINSAQAAKVLGKKGYIKCKIELIDAATNEVIGLINESEYSAANLPEGKPGNYNLNTGETAKKTVRIKITASSNIDDLQGVLLNEYDTINKEMLSKMATQRIELKKPGIITNYALEQNYPNPFNPTTIINYQLPKDGIVTLKVYDMLGREVATLVNNESKAVGRYNINFSAGNLASGVYIYQLRINDAAGREGFNAVKKLLLLK